MEVQRFLCLALVPSTSAREVWGYSEHTIRRQKELFHTRGILDLEGIRMRVFIIRHFHQS